MFDKILKNMPNIVKQVYDAELDREIKFPRMSLLRIPLFKGRLLIKLNKDSLFSERNNHVPTIVIGKYRLTWRKYQ